VSSTLVHELGSMGAEVMEYNESEYGDDSDEYEDEESENSDDS